MKNQKIIPESKKKSVEELKNLIKSKKTILVTSIKNIPTSQFQEIGKKLRGKAVVKVPKKSILFRAIDESKLEKLKELEQKIEESFAVLFSDVESFELAYELDKSKRPAKAKPDQISPEDIYVEAGPTDLVPGAAISELGAFGIQIQIEKGKIHIKEPRLIAKKDERITQAVADIMSKLDIKPFTVGLKPIAAYDVKENKIFLEININKEEALKELVECEKKAIGFALKIEYFCEQTIKLLIGKASSQEKILNRIISGEGEEEKHLNEKEDITAELKEEKAPSASEGLSALFG